MDKLWVDYIRRDQTKSSVLAVHPAFPKYVTCLLQQSLRNNSAAICCVGCALREDLHMGKWNKLLLNIIADFGKNLYARSVKMLRLKSKHYVSLEQLVSSFYIGDWKYTIKLEEALRGNLDLENHCERDTFECSMNALLKTGDSFILSLEEHNWSVWIGDNPHRPSTSTTCYVLDPHRYQKDDPSDPFAKVKIHPSIIRFIHPQYLLNDLYTCFDVVTDKTKAFVLSRFSLESKQMITRNPSEKFEIFIGKHCPNAMGAFEKFFSVKRKKDTTPGLVLPEEGGEKSIADSVTDRGSGFFLNPQKQFSCCPEKEHCKKICTVCKNDFKKHLFLDKGLLDCAEVKRSKKELDHNFYVRHESGGECWVLEGNHGLASFRECSGHQGITVAITALRRIDRKFARSWDKKEIDEIVKVGTVMFKEFCRQTCQFQRPTLLGLCRCLGASETWGGWHAKTVAWGGRPGLPALIAGLLSNNGRGLLQLPGSLDVAIWKDREHFYLFMPDDKGDEESPSRNVFFHTVADMSTFLANIIPTTADICVSRIDFIKEESTADIGGDKSETFKCLCILKSDIIQYKYGLPASVALLTLITASEKTSESWQKRDIDQIIDHATSYLDTTVDEEKKTAGEQIDFHDFPKLFVLEGFGVVETEIFQDVVRGRIQYTTEKSNVLGLTEGFVNFFKEYAYGVLRCRGVTLPIWKSLEGNLFYIKYTEKKTEEGDGFDFCMLRVENEELMAQYIEGDLPVSRDDQFCISAVHVTMTKVDPVSGSPKIQLKGGYNWLVENQIAILRSWECPKTVSECTLPAALLFGCASSLLPPNKFTAHHLSSFVECSYDVSSRLKKQFRLLTSSVLDRLTTENITFGMHSFQLQLGPKINYFFDRANRIDYSVLPVARNVSPQKYNPGALARFIEKAFSLIECQLLMVRINDTLVVSVWRLWIDGPVVLFQPLSYFAIPPILDIWRLDETVPNAVKPPAKAEKGKKGKKGKKGGKGKKKGKKGKKGAVAKEGPRPAVSIYLYPSLKQLAKHIGTILPNGFSEGRLVAYPIKTKILTEVISMIVNPDTIKAIETVHPLPKIGKNFTLWKGDTWYILGNNIYENKNQGIEKKDMDFSASVMAVVVESIESVTHWKSDLLDMIVKYGHLLYTTKAPGACGKKKPFTVPNNFFVSDFKISVSIAHNYIVGDMTASDNSGEVYNLVSGLNFFFGNEDKSYGILMAKNYTVAVWKMNFLEYKRYRKAKEEYDYFKNQTACGEKGFGRESKASVLKRSGKNDNKLEYRGDVPNNAILYPDDFEVPSNEATPMEVIKTAEHKPVKGKGDKNKGKKGKKDKGKVEGKEPSLALLPEVPSAHAEMLPNESFRTMISSKEASEHSAAQPPPPPPAGGVDADVPTEIEKHADDDDEDLEPGVVDGGEGELPIVEQLTESLQDMGSEEEDSEEGSIISPVLSYTTEEEISESGSSVTAPSFSESFYPDDCAVFLWDPAGHCSSKLYAECGKPVTVSFRSTKDLAAFFLENANESGLGSNRFALHSVQIEWRHKTYDERAASPRCPPKPRGCRDCRVGEEAATAYVHPGGGRTYLIASDKRTKKIALRNTVCWCVAALVMHHLLDINLWSTLTLDDIDAISAELKSATEKKIANGQSENKDRLIQPLDVIKEFMLSKRQVHVEVEEIFDIQIEGNDNFMEKFKFALELFFKGKDPLGFLQVEDRPCCAMWKSQEPNKFFLAINWPKNHIVMYDTIENFITGYLTAMREIKECILHIKLFKIFVTSKNQV